MHAISEFSLFSSKLVFFAITFPEVDTKLLEITGIAIAARPMKRSSQLVEIKLLASKFLRLVLLLLFSPRGG